MEKHYGKIIERIVRRSGYSISALAKSINVSRSCIYRWFERPELKAESVFKIGCALKYDFSAEFPELFDSEEFHEAFNNVNPSLKSARSAHKSTI